MRFSGRVFKVKNFWAIEVPMLGITTQGRTKRDAFNMVKDAVESLVDREGFSVSVHPGQKEYFEIGSNDLATFVAFMLKRMRQKYGLSLQEVAERMGSKSPNAYARYEQGKTVPTIETLGKLLSAVAVGEDFTISLNRVP
ncbi:MAG: helix-turn-helix transcriptional regulator [Bacteroidia bacterium]|nr:helix-turn-helix transcriptional regulator [Bacteroidia bacterium]